MTQEPRGFAYILFANSADAKRAISEMDQSTPFNDWKIKVEHAKRCQKVDESIIKEFHSNKEVYNRNLAFYNKRHMPTN